MRTYGFFYDGLIHIVIFSLLILTATNIFVAVCCNYIRNIWWDLIIEDFCLEPYVEVATRIRYYTNIIKRKKMFEVQTDRPGYFVTSISIN
jgi:hypothetical protein